MKNIKKLVSILLVAAMLTGILPVHALDLRAAAVSSVASGSNIIHSTHINPEYAHLPHEIPDAPAIPLDASGEGKTVATFEEAAAYLRSQMAARAPTITFHLTDYDYTSSDQVKADWSAILDKVFAHTGDPKYGDYLDRHCGGCSMSGSMSGTTLTSTFTVEYYTTAAQEAEMDSAVDALIDDLETEHAISSLSDYDKVRIIYDYICDNVVYDYDNLEDDTYNLKYTAYAALINGTSVCQGYASLFYRLALTLGVDARYISGYAAGGNHGWNIVDMGDYYYYLDATWDAGCIAYSYFLTGSEQFHADHTPRDEYLTAEFAAQYPIDTENFVHPDYEVTSGTCGANIAWSLNSNGRLTLTGTGAMTDYYSSNDIPWADFTSAIRSVSISDGITSLSFCAFYYCTALEEVTLPASITSIGQYAFHCTALATVYYAGSAEQWNAISINSNNDPLLAAEIIFADAPTTHTLADGGDLLALLASDAVRDGDTIELLGTAHVNDVDSDSAPWVITKAVTLRGGTIDLRAGGILLGADVTFDSVMLSFANRVRNVIMANGHTLTLNNVTQDTSANEVHLFCGSLTGHTVTAPMGEHGRIIIQGSTSLGNIYAGSLSSDGADNSFDLSATLTVDSSATGSMGEFFACGALETPIPDNEMINPDYVVAPPTAREDTFIVTGEVHLELYQGVIRTVNGTTGGASNASVTYNGNDYLCTLALAYVDALTVASGKLRPDALFQSVNITLAQDALLDLSALTYNPSCNDFAGGGTLVLDDIQTFTISGALTGTTAVAIGGVDYYGMSEIAFTENTLYIVTSEDVVGSFTALSESFTLENIDGNWMAVAVEADAPVVKPASFTIEQTNYAVSVEDMAYGITVAAEFTGLSEDEFFSDIPLTIAVSKNGADAATADRSYDSEWGYLYGAVHGIAIATAEEYAGLSLYFYDDDTDDAVIAEGAYTITIAATLADDTVCEITLTLTVGETEPEGPTLIASGTCGDNLTWTLDENGLLTISGTGEMTNYLSGDAPWYEYSSRQLRTVEIAEGVTTIGSNAFSACSRITSVTIPDSVAAIGKNAFYYCTSLTSITIPDGVTILAEGVFNNCYALASVTLPEGLTSIGDNAFNGCNALSSITIPDSVTSIGKFAFYSCDHLSEITIPTGVTVIEDYTFDFCSRLASVALPDGLTSIGSQAFGNCLSLTQIVLPEGLTTIGGSAFIGCEILAEVSLPSTLSTVDYNAFDECTALTTVYYNGTEKQWSKIKIMSGNDPLINAEKTFVEPSGFCGDDLTWVLSGDGVLTISGTGEMDGYGMDGAPWYNYRSDITSIEISEGATSIGSHAFYGCAALTSITIPEGVVVIGANVFEECDALTYITLPDGLTTIGASAFYGCDALESVTIPESVTTIGDWAFYNCCALTSITLPDGLTSINARVFTSCISLASVTLPKSLTSIGADAFNCTALTEIVIPEGVTTIGAGAFSYCSNLESATIPGSAASIAGNVFNCCTSLTSVTITDGVKSLGNQMFFGCEKLTSIALPDSVTSIGWDTFASCTALTEITVPESVTIIRGSAFHGCTALETVCYGGTLDQWSSISIGTNNDDLLRATIIYTGGSITTSGTCGKRLKWTLNTDGLLTISGEGAMTDYNGADMPWYAYREQTTAIEISESVTTIGNHAFSGCVNLESVVISEDMTSIGNAAFYGCWSLAEVILPDGVTSIGEYAFYACASLVYIEIPDGVTSINRFMFADCTSLMCVTIPASVKIIGFSAFLRCTNLATVYYSGSTMQWRNVGDDGENDALFSAKIISTGNVIVDDGFCGENLTWAMTNDGLLTISGEGEMNHYDVGTTPWYAYCEQIIIVQIEEGVTTIGKYAFHECPNLEGVAIPESLTSISNAAFMMCRSLESITIPGSVTSIGGFAFCDCTSLTEIVIPVSVTSIGNSVFLDCDSLTSIEIPDSVTTIGDYAFSGCSTLTDITLPKSMTAIQDGTFSHCESLTSIEIPDSVTSIDNSAFSDCDSLTSLEIPDSVTSIGNSAFSDCDSLITIELPGSVTTIGDSIFSGCEKLESVTILGAVSSITESMFNGCISLTSVTIAEGVRTIDRSAFSSCTALESIIIPNGVTTIAVYAFQNCTSLAEITLPRSVQIIYNTAFYDCTTLETVYYGGNEAQWYNVEIEMNNDPLLNANVICTGPEFIASGECGYFLFWTLDEDGLLTISDSGSMYDYEPEEAPWYDYRDQITVVEISTGVRYICKRAFQYCSNLREFVAESDSSHFISLDGILFTRDQTELVAFPAAKQVAQYTIPDSVNAIGNDAFSGCSALASVAIGDSVTTIGNYAFSNCHSLTTVYYSGSEEQWNAITIGSNNDPLLNAEIIFAAPMAGDLNGDDDVTVRDVIILLDAIAARSTGEWTDDQRTAADMSGDGRISVRDAIIILDAIAARTTDEL